MRHAVASRSYQCYSRTRCCRVNLLRLHKLRVVPPEYTFWSPETLRPDLSQRVIQRIRLGVVYRVSEVRRINDKIYGCRRCHSMTVFNVKCGLKGPTNLV